MFKQIRQTVLNKIDDIKQRNLCEIVFAERQNTSKWAHLIYDCDLKFEQKIELISKELVLIDTVIIHDEQCDLGISLWIVPNFL